MERFNLLTKSLLFFPALAMICSFLITWVSIPSIIQVARLKHLFDEPDDNRKLHKRVVPTLGGLAIFAGSIISLMLFTDTYTFHGRQFVMAALLILFFLGIKDDIIILSPYSKFLGQFIAALIVVWAGDIRIDSWGGVFGVYSLSYEVSIAFSVLFIMLSINAFNMIDGIDALAGSIGLITAGTFAWWFYHAGYPQPLIFATAIMGSILAFLQFNITPARIFMGDTGSMLIGTIIGILTILFINLNHLVPVSLKINSAPVVAFGIIIIPVFDLLRVFVLRLLKGRSPFHADNLHMHHQLLILGFSHINAAMLLAFVNLVFIALAFLLNKIQTEVLFSLLLGFAILLSIIVDVLVKRKLKK